MIEANILLALHLLAAVVWVGGMGFALLVLRPSLAVLQPPQRLALHAQVFRRFFRIVWHVMPIQIITGYAMIFRVFGGFRGVGWPVHLMNSAGLVMAVVFVVIFFRPWRAFQAAMAAGDLAAAAASADLIRRLIMVNLVIGLATVAVAGWKY